MSTKPKCPDCDDESLSFFYAGTVEVNLHLGIVNHGGVSGVYPYRIECFECGWQASEEETARLTDQLEEWLSPHDSDRLETGFDWPLQ